MKENENSFGSNLLPTCNPGTDEDIATEVQGGFRKEREAEENAEDEKIESPPSSKEVRLAVAKVKRGFMCDLLMQLDLQLPLSGCRSDGDDLFDGNY